MNDDDDGDLDDLVVVDTIIDDWNASVDDGATNTKTAAETQAANTSGLLSVVAFIIMLDFTMGSYL